MFLGVHAFAGGGIGEVAVAGVEDTTEAEAQGLAEEGAHDITIDRVGFERSVAVVEGALELRAGAEAADIDEAAVAVAADEGGLGTAEDFDAIYGQETLGVGEGLAKRHVIDINGGGGGAEEDGVGEAAGGIDIAKRAGAGVGGGAVGGEAHDVLGLGHAESVHDIGGQKTGADGFGLGIRQGLTEHKDSGQFHGGGGGRIGRGDWGSVLGGEGESQGRP